MTKLMIAVLCAPVLRDCTRGEATHHSATSMIVVTCGKDQPLLRPSQREIFSFVQKLIMHFLNIQRPNPKT